MMSRAACGVGMVLAGLLLAACGDSPVAPPTPAPTPTPTPTPDPITQVIPVEGSGRVRIEFAGANVAPGSTVTGCGSRIAGCTDRLRVSLRLLPSASGHALYVRIYLHATNQQACLWGQAGAMELQAGVPATVEVPLDRADDCATPLTFVSMDGIVEGTVEVASRQVWTLHYVFAP